VIAREEERAEPAQRLTSAFQRPARGFECPETSARACQAWRCAHIRTGPVRRRRFSPLDGVRFQRKVMRATRNQRCVDVALPSVPNFEFDASEPSSRQGTSVHSRAGVASPNRQYETAAGHSRTDFRSPLALDQFNSTQAPCWRNAQLRCRSLRWFEPARPFVARSRPRDILPQVGYRADPALPVRRVALTLDRADASGFTGAFRRWVGTMPERWRTERGRGRLASHKRRATEARVHVACCDNRAEFSQRTHRRLR